ncbi:MAG: NAD(P)H-dependent oxidoreductase [Candidatus Omnitrophica bacterium]|nr:NAD(P)H-dependent oxidoreductase [Candidatus Omnitrophota bacterium]
MNIVIVVHSVCGHTYLVAKSMLQACTALGHDCLFRRVADPGWTPQSDTPADAQELLSEMNQLPVALPDDLLNADLVIIGSPTYFGNVSGQMKTFMDATAVHWFHSRYAGKRLAAFTSAGSTENGANLCLQNIHCYACHMGMIPVPVPNQLLPGQSVCPYGIVYVTDQKYAQALDEKTRLTIEKYAGFLTRS